MTLQVNVIYLFHFLANRSLVSLIITKLDDQKKEISEGKAKELLYGYEYSNLVLNHLEDQTQNDTQQFSKIFQIS